MRPRADDVRDAPPARVLGGSATGLLSGPLAAALIGGLCFANSLSNGFAYDDIPIIRDSPRIRSLASFPQIFLEDYWAPVDEEQAVLDRQRDRLYRPITILTFALNYALHADHPLGYHLVNVALHMLACALVWRFVMQLFDDRAVAATAALLFAVHPVHCEAVANVVGRGEILSAVFLLSGIGRLMPQRSGPIAVRESPFLISRSAALLAMLCFLSAMLAKETAVCFPALVMIALHYRAKHPAAQYIPDARRAARLAAVLLLPLFLYFPLRYIALDGFLIRDREPNVVMNPLIVAEGVQRIWGALSVLGHYVRLLVAPANLSSNYGLAVIDPVAGPDSMALLGALGAIGLAAALAGYARGREVWRRAACSAALFLASYALVSNTALRIGVSVAERLLYLPSVPALMLIAVLLVAAWRRYTPAGRPLARSAPLLRGLAAALVLGLSVRTLVRNGDWANNLALFSADLRTFPQSAELNTGYGIAQMLNLVNTPQEQLADAVLEADRAFAEALRIAPRYDVAMRSRATTRMLLGDFDGALELLDAVLLRTPEDRRTRALITDLRGQADRERIEALRKNLAMQPDDDDAKLELGERLLRVGRAPEALELLREQSRRRPENANALRLLGDACIAQGMPGDALAAYRKAAKLAPDDWRIYVNLATLLSTIDAAESLLHAQRAHALQPDALETNQNLAEALAANGRFAEALAIYQRIRPGLVDGGPFAGMIDDRITELRRKIGP